MSHITDINLFKSIWGVCVGGGEDVQAIYELLYIAHLKNNIFKTWEGTLSGINRFSCDSLNVSWKCIKSDMLLCIKSDSSLDNIHKVL